MSDPINPAHYDGTACARLGERMSGNSYQVLKYNWRLGKKDDPVIETGKSLWYLDREIANARQGFTFLGDPLDDMRTNELLAGVDQYVQYVAWRLTEWCRNGHIDSLILLRHAIVQKRAEMEQAATGQVTMAI